MVERLFFGSTSQYSPIEAAIHINRYLISKDLCQGSKILDVACGEGYGAFLMAEHWGAALVDAVDISEEAIERAKDLFNHQVINFHCKPIEQLEEFLPSSHYDCIISLETIEHVADPAKFLHALKRLVKPEGVIIISCPNDYWYYPNSSPGNPFHYNKYTLQDFKNLTESILGKAHGYFMGTGLVGFANVPLDNSINLGKVQSDMLSYKELTNTIALPAVCSEMPDAANCAYYIGVWGECSLLNSTAACYTQSLDSFQNIKYIQELNSRAALATKEHKKVTIQLQAVQYENEFLKKQLQAYIATSEHLQLVKKRSYFRSTRLYQLAKKLYSSLKYRGLFKTGYLILRKIYYKLLG